MKRMLAIIMTMALASARKSPEDNLCCLCKDCRAGVPGRGGLFLDKNGLTCGQLDLDLTLSYVPRSEDCTMKVNRYRPSCCDENFDPHPIVQPPTPSPRSKYPQGTHPVCDICYGGDFPRKPYTVTAVLYIQGNPTCEDLYYLGLTGNIPNRVCYPLQLYMEGPCGCGDVSPTSLPPSPPTPSPTQETTLEPTPSPTLEPTPSPTLEPTAVPTKKKKQNKKKTKPPTAGPTRLPTAEPTAVPTKSPTSQPTADPTTKPLPTELPTRNPVPQRKKRPVSTNKDSLRLPVDTRKRGSGNIRG